MSAIELIFSRSRPNAYIAFGARYPTKTTGEVVPHYMFVLKVRDRHEWLPAVLQHQIEQTQYIMQNTLASSALTSGTDDDYLEAIRRGDRLYYAAKNKHVFELAALVVDLDVGRDPDDPTAWDALAVVGNMSDAGELPLPSLAALSGRGAYLWWLLTDEDGRPPLATPDNRARWNLVVGELVNRTRNLKADSNAKRIANWYKRPGTLDTKTGNVVKYLTIGVNSPSAVPLYRLPEIVEQLDLHHAPAELPVSPPAALPTPSVRPPRRKSGSATNARAPHHRRVCELERLAVSRGGFPEGMRHHALFHYYHSRRMYLVKAYRADDVDRPEARAVQQAARDLVAFNASYCSPPQSDEEVAGIYRNNKLSFGRYKARRATVAADLSVTRTECYALDLQSIATAEVIRERELEDEARRAGKAARQERIAELLKQGHGVRETARRARAPVSTVQYRMRKLRDAGELPTVGDEQGELLDDDLDPGGVYES